MEAFKEAIAASMEQSLILKGKRTKRHRPQSPIHNFSISPTPIEKDPIVLDCKKDGGHVIMSSSSSASWSSIDNPTLKADQEDKEDQDIANCLILLSQGQQFKTPNQETNRFNSRKFLETSSSSNGGAKAGYYVYQCKTCDRTFPSFQALGGHRASHKKPKATPFYFNLENDAVSVMKPSTIYKNNKNRSLVVFGKASNNKVHECGICGAEFTSGQALGGHMRRHRGAVAVPTAAAPIVTTKAATPANTELSLSSMSFDQISDGQDHLAMPVTKRAKKTVVSLDLDLNLPAPEDENQVNNRFSFASRQKQEEEHTKQREETKSLVLSVPTLVDCHY